MSVCEGEEVWPEGVSLASGWHDGGSSLQGGQGTKGKRGGFLTKTMSCPMKHYGYEYDLNIWE